ncbi:hypothetical protein [Pigmentiphaga litoralis]|uniref:Uncharacterized protein n=1 Tax=Pigmentiphaga litoralis TaxID=516702 RepID=A0A7Y9IY41_9BURK|nr:hypothetical protein [Pigmentiphaga litoralis]NYE26115.1 hypothetical protein [Pigmentiphaga litoralis]NYE85235.1 hypothetical protein [Pigmentiphaga litoralis]
MSPLGALGIGAVIGLLVGAGAGWTAQGWRGTAQTQTQVAVVATARKDAATAARNAEPDQRLIEFNRMEANAQVTYNDKSRRDENAQASRIMPLLLSACGTPLPPPKSAPPVVRPAAIPEPAPALMTPVPYESWRESARQNTERWQTLLSAPALP